MSARCSFGTLVAALCTPIVVGCVNSPPPNFAPDNRTFEQVVGDVRAYASIPRSQDATVIRELMQQKNTQPPLYLYELSRRLTDIDESEALYFMYLGVVRMTYDAKRCSDDGALAVMFFIAKELPQQSQELEANLSRAKRAKRLADTLREIEARDEMFDSTVSPRWICSYVGSDSVTNTQMAEGMLKPTSEWAAVQHEIRTELRKSIEKQRSPLFKE